MADETTIRNLAADLAAIEAGHSAEIRAIKEDMTEVKGDVKTILSAVQGLELYRAETTGRDKMLVYGGSGVIALGMSWLSKHMGLG